MFERRSKVSEYTREQTLCWLTWLARALMRNNLGVFYVERMQSDWLPSLAQQLIVAIVPIIFFGLVAALISGLVFGGLVAALISGLAMAAMILAPPQVHGITPAEDDITPVEALRWSWRSVQQRNWLSIWLGTALTGGLAGVVALIHELPKGLGTALTSGLVFGLFMLLFGLLFGLTSGLVVGLPLGLVRGGVAYIKHYTLRILLWRNDYAPWNYIRFLDYAAERIFLRKVGGGYTFYHPLLMEYFATLQPTDQAGQTQSA